MQKHLRINYCSSYSPYWFSLILLFVISASLWLLNIHILLLWVFLALFPMLILSNLGHLYRYPCVIDYDGEFWHIHEQKQSITVDLLPESLVTRYFLVLVFKAQGRNKQFRYYFSKDNCSPADFRALCRLSLHQ